MLAVSTPTNRSRIEPYEQKSHDSSTTKSVNMKLSHNPKNTALNRDSTSQIDFRNSQKDFPSLR